MPAKQASHRHKRKTPDNFHGTVVDTGFSAFEEPLGLAGAAPNQVDAAAVLQTE
jgi:hypothetical protein